MTARGIKFIALEPPSPMGFQDYQSIALMQYIVTIDVLCEAIVQLHRVLYSNLKYAFSGDKSIFAQTIDDDKYFKHIRAAFSTHPINLDSIDGCNLIPNERYYASWSSGSMLGDNDFVVNLYSNNPNHEESFELGFCIDDINRYCKTRYDLLNDFIDRVSIIENELTEKFRKRKIKRDSNIIAQLEILIRENTERYSEYYGHAYDLYYIRDLLRAYYIDGHNDSIVDKYVAVLTNDVWLISNDIQNMSHDYSRIKPSYTYSYEIEKLYSYFINGHPIGEIAYNRLLECNFLPISLANKQDKNLQLLYLDSYLLNYNMRMNIPFDISDLYIGMSPDAT